MSNESRFSVLDEAVRRRLVCSCARDDFERQRRRRLQDINFGPFCEYPDDRARQIVT